MGGNARRGCGVNTVAFVASVVVGCLLAETRVSRANERRLRQRGATAPPGDVYRWMAVLYPAAFVTMAAEGMWRAAHEGAPPTGGPNWFVSGVLLFVASKALKYWAIRTLGERWTFRVFIVRDLPLIITGPYRYVAHPNYVAVVGELVSTAMMCGAPVAGTASVILFGAVLWMRVRFESGVLRRVAGRE
jgi:methyltransferase